MATKIQYSEEKLTELVLYIGAKCALDEYYGVLKLNKILFYSDFHAFRTRGKPITGVEYRKYPHGPAPSVMKRLRSELEQRGDAFEYHVPLSHFGSDAVEKRLLPRRSADMDKLAADEIAIVDSVIETLRPMTGTEVSKLSHRHPGWRLAQMEATIPYVAALLTEAPPHPVSAADFKRALAVADEFAAGSLPR